MQYFRLYRAVANPIQVCQGFFIGKDPLPQHFSQQHTVFHSSGETLLNGPQQFRVGSQQIMVDFVTVQNHAVRLGDTPEQGGFSTAGAAGNAKNHASASASTMWNAAALRSRFWTA